MSDHVALKATLLILVSAIIVCATASGMSITAEKDPNASCCCCNDDGPACYFCGPDGFKNGGAWDPSGAWIQDVAYDTVGTEESCWDSTGESGSGKPFYQMRLGINSWDDAKTLSCLLQAMENDPILNSLAGMYTRQAWCSETISYWHREAGIPYTGGYRGGDWLYDWQLPNTTSLILFYATEEILAAASQGLGGGPGGRGRWIDWSDLDYDNFQLGVNAPVPGSYVCIHCYDNGQFSEHGHSMMIDEMTVYRTLSGKVSRVHVNLLEGNTAVGVNHTREMSDLIGVVPGGAGFFDGCSDGGDMRIVGFGVDLDDNGNPVYDPSRLHYVTTTETALRPDHVVTSFPIWDQNYAPYVQQLVDYTTMVRQAGGIKVQANAGKGAYAGIPDGNAVTWHFAQTSKKADSREGGTDPITIDIEIDLLDEHPIPMMGLMLKWAPGFIPQGYHVLFAGTSKDYREARVPNFSRVEGFSNDLNVPIPVLFNPAGAPVRYIRFVFPPECFPQPATLVKVRILHQWGEDTDTPVDRSR